MRKLLWLLVPGGSIVALLLYLRGRSKQSAAARQAAASAGSSAFNADPLAAAQQATQNAVNYVTAESQTLRSAGLAGDPLAQALLGVSGAALTPPTSPTDVAANQAKAKQLNDEIATLTAQLTQDQAAYASPNHNGGQSPAQEAAIESPIAARISSDQAALAALGATT